MLVLEVKSPISGYFFYFFPYRGDAIPLTRYTPGTIIPTQSSVRNALSSIGD